MSEMQLPPDLLAALGGAGAAGGPPEQGPGDPVELLRQILDLADEYKSVERDEEDILVIEKVTSIVQGLLAKNQREDDGMMQGKLTPRALRRAAGGP
jgi:hypothetical protein